MSHEQPFNVTEPKIISEIVMARCSVGEDSIAVPIDMSLYYDPDDPYAVTSVFQNGNNNSRWMFSGDLLSEGLYEPAGDGDVHIWPDVDEHERAVVVIEIISDDGEALIEAPSSDIAAFVRRIQLLVATGSESEKINFDSWIAGVLEKSIE